MIKKQERAEVGRVDTRFVPELTQLEIEEVNKTRYDKTVRMSVSLVKEWDFKVAKWENEETAENGKFGTRKEKRNYETRAKIIYGEDVPTFFYKSPRSILESFVEIRLDFF